MNKKILLIGMLSSLPFLSFADTQSQNYANGTNLMNIQNAANLDGKFVSSKKMYYITDATSVVKMFNLNLSVNGQSSIDNSKNGVMIVSTGTVKDYLNILGDKFGYSWTLNGSSVVFTPLIPMVTKTSPIIVSPVIIPQQVSMQKETIIESTPVKAVVLLPKKEASAPTIQKLAVVTPVTPIISTVKTTPDKNSGTWDMKVSDKTVKKTMQRWATQAGWQLIWNANVDFPISAEMKIDGTFDYAVNEICRASQFTDNKIIGEFHPKNKVLVITTQDL